MQWPAVTELSNVTITPVAPGAGKKRVEFAASQPAPVLRHHRFGLAKSVATISRLSDAEARGARVIEEPTIYGGLLFNHFGHAIAESMHRLWPKFALNELQWAKVAFSSVKDADITPYFAEALELHGISEEEVFKIEEPLCFRRLFVGPQARQMGGPTIVEAYQTLLDASLDERFPPGKRDRQLYISRLDYHRSGSFYGETEVSRQLASEGFEIVYPERHSLTELVAMLRRSKLAIFAEGSAIHALELCGSAVPDVLVIARRPQPRESVPLLANICSRWMVSDHILLNAGLSNNSKKHSGVVALPAVMRDIHLFTGIGAGREWTSAWAMQAINEDVDRLINHTTDGSAEDIETRAAELKLAIRNCLDAKQRGRSWEVSG